MKKLILATIICSICGSTQSFAYNFGKIDTNTNVDLGSPLKDTKIKKNRNNVKLNGPSFANVDNTHNLNLSKTDRGSSLSKKSEQKKSAKKTKTIKEKPSPLGNTFNEKTVKKEEDTLETPVIKDYGFFGADKNKNKSNLNAPLADLKTLKEKEKQNENGENKEVVNTPTGGFFGADKNQNKPNGLGSTLK